MSDNSKIEWTDASWNCVTGCTKVSPGCDHCYAETFAERWRGTPGHHFEQGFDVRLWPDRLEIPLHWKRPRKVFVNSMSDLFHDEVPDDFIARMFAVMALTARHAFQVLTKRHGRMRSLLSSADFRVTVAEHATDLIASRFWQCWQLDLGGERLAGDSGLGGGWTVTPVKDGNLWLPPWPLPNAWLGVSVEDQKRADLRIPALLETPAAIRFLSCEPLLGHVDIGLTQEWDGCTCGAGPGSAYGIHEPYCGLEPGPAWNRLHWIIAGGESGPKARRSDPQWFRSLKSQCAITGTPFFMKQAGTVLAREWGCSDRKGHSPDEWPEPFPRQFPLADALAGAK